MKAILIGILALYIGNLSAQEAQIKYFPKRDSVVVDSLARDSIPILRNMINELKLLVDSLDTLEDSLLVYNYSQFKNVIKMSTLKKGTIKFYNESKGFGFVIDNDSNDEYFVHASKLKDSVTKGNIVQFEAVETKKGKQAFNVQLV